MHSSRGLHGGVYAPGGGGVRLVTPTESDSPTPGTCSPTS